MQKALAILGIILLAMIGATFYATVFQSTDEVVRESSYVDLGEIAPPEPPPETFSEFMKVPPSPAQEVLRQEIYDDVYTLTPCSDMSSASVLVLLGQYREIDGVNTFVAAQEAMVDFENDAYRDWGPAIFGASYVPSSLPPQISLERITNSHVLAESQTRLFHSDVNKSLYYGWTLNYLIVAPSSECLIETMESVYHIH